MIIIDSNDNNNQELPTMRITASEEDMVKFKPEDASLTEANMRAVLKKFKVRLLLRTTISTELY